jgi:hypothetical protein
MAGTVAGAAIRSGVVVGVALLAAPMLLTRLEPNWRELPLLQRLAPREGLS